MFRILSILLGIGTSLCLVAQPISANPVYTEPSLFERNILEGNMMLAASQKQKSRVSPNQQADPGASQVPRTMESHLRPSDTATSAANLTAQSEATTNGFLEIEVSHSQHTFRLLERDGVSQNVLYECRIGLGSPEFPTPVGTYYVTHIYDDDPWWIPPKDRAWAAGDVPSRKVYGGTMAPLLKKKPVRQKRLTGQETEDMIAGEVQLDDYGYRFHGTNAPRSIGRNQSHGCVRMISADAKKVAGIIKDKVGILDRKESENGTYAILRSPVILHLVK